MAGVKITEIRLHRVSLPLKKPFKTHLQSVSERESIILEMVDKAGETGLGECVAFSSPWYTEETVQTCWDALKSWLIPSVMNQSFSHPSHLENLLKHVKGNRMAKAALDSAAWDLFAKTQNLPLWRVIGGKQSQIDAGIVLTGPVDKAMFAKAEQAALNGYKRVKVKIDSTTNPTKLKELIQSQPTLLFFADANGIFHTLGLDALLAFDNAGLDLIEQPFTEDDWELHQQASRNMDTPIALDESIRSLDDVQRMIEMKAGSIIVLKPGRVGGISEALRIHGTAKQHNLPIWIGGMIEFGVSKAHNLALVSLPQMTFPGDFSASNHFWHEDVIHPPIELSTGTINLTEEKGIGCRIDLGILEKYRTAYKVFK